MFVVQGQRRLGEACDACGRVQMADVGLDRAEARKIDRIRLAAVGFRQGRNFNRVTKIGAGAVTFDHANALCGNTCGVQRLNDGGRLSIDGRGQIARLGSTVVVDGRAFDHGPDVIAVGNGIRQAAQRNSTRAGTKDGALGAVIERMAMPVGGQDFVFLEQITTALRQLNRDTARDGHIDLARVQRLTGIMDRHQRGRTGGLQVDRRPFQVEHMAHPGRQEILVVAGVAQQKHANVINQIRVGADVEIEIAAHAAACINTDGAIDAFRRTPALLHRLPRDLKKFAVLRIKDSGIFGGKAEKFGIKCIKPVQHGGGGHIVLAGNVFGAFTGGQQVFFGKAPDGFNTIPQIGPIGIDPLRTRYVDRHADDRNVF